MSDQWFAQQHGRTFGPMSLDALKASMATGKINIDAMVRYGAEGQWTPAQTVESLRAFAPSPQRPPLVGCPDCDGKVSSSAAACPHCGCPMGSGEFELQIGDIARTWRGIALAALCVLTLISLFVPAIFLQTLVPIAVIAGSVFIACSIPSIVRPRHK
jgi:hypothetical protein